MMQAMGVPPTGQVAIAVAQRGVLQNPGGATGNLGGAAAGVARRSLGRGLFRKEVARQVQGGTPTVNNNPVATKLLLEPTFTPIQANAVLDQTNMRIAIPVRQVDGEYILTMQKMEGARPVQPAQGEGQQATPVEGQTPSAEASARPAEGNAPTIEAGAGSNSTASATPEAEKKPERRQESNKDKYGNDKPPQGAVIMTMKMIDDMADAVKWGGQAAITQMMSEYVKAQTGNDLQSITNNGTEAATANIVV
jgi:hypothetical protein